MCDLRQDTCLFVHGGVDPARTQVSPGVFGAFLHCDNCDKNRHRHLVPVLGTLEIRTGFPPEKKNRVEIRFVSLAFGADEPSSSEPTKGLNEAGCAGVFDFFFWVELTYEPPRIRDDADW